MREMKKKNTTGVELKLRKRKKNEIKKKMGRKCAHMHVRDVQDGTALLCYSQEEYNSCAFLYLITVYI